MWALAALWHLLGQPARRRRAGRTRLLLVVGAGPCCGGRARSGRWSLLAVGGPGHGVGGGAGPRQPLAAGGPGRPGHPARGRRSAWLGDAGPTPADFADRFFPAARLCLLGFYVFASFAKLNSAFFDRSTSCAAFYFRRVDRLRRPVRLCSSTEPPGLAVGRDRRHRRDRAVDPRCCWCSGGRATSAWSSGSLFHAVLALDRTHQFFDFSSVLAALFVLFLPRRRRGVGGRAGGLGPRPAGSCGTSAAPRWVHLALVAVPVLAGMAVAFDRRRRREHGPATWVGGPGSCTRVAAASSRRSGTCGSARRRRIGGALRVRPRRLPPRPAPGGGQRADAVPRAEDGLRLEHVRQPAHRRRRDEPLRRPRARCPSPTPRPTWCGSSSTDDPGLAVYARPRLRAHLAAAPDLPVGPPGRADHATAAGNAMVALGHASDDPELVEPAAALAGEAAAVPGRRRSSRRSAACRPSGPLGDLRASHGGAARLCDEITDLK